MLCCCDDCVHVNNGNSVKATRMEEILNRSQEMTSFSIIERVLARREKNLTIYLRGLEANTFRLGNCIVFSFGH